MELKDSPDIGHFKTLDFESPPPVQLHLMGKQPSAIEPDFRPQSHQDRPDPIGSVARTAGAVSWMAVPVAL
jgi:hypothetical protein